MFWSFWGRPLQVTRNIKTMWLGKRPNNGQFGVSCDDPGNRLEPRKKEAERKQRMRMSGSETDPLMLFRPLWEDGNKRYLKPLMAPVETIRKLEHGVPYFRGLLSQLLMKTRAYITHHLISSFSLQVEGKSN